jgi:hypothetical protein
MRPEIPKELASVTVSNTPAIVDAVSEKGSFIKVSNLFPIIATINPIKMPPKNLP